MSRAQQVAWFATRKEADAFEAKLHAQALANGQKCDKWSDIIVDKTLGYGVPFKERVLSAATSAELTRVKQWTPPTKAIA